MKVILKLGQSEYKWVAYLVNGQCCAFSFIHIDHVNIPRPAVSFKQLPTCVFLFTIYASQRPTPLPKLRLTRKRTHEFSQPEGILSGTEELKCSPCTRRQGRHNCCLHYKLKKTVHHPITTSKVRNVATARI